MLRETRPSRTPGTNGTRLTLTQRVMSHVRAYSTFLAYEGRLFYYIRVCICHEATLRLLKQLGSLQIITGEVLRGVTMSENSQETGTFRSNVS